MRQRGSTAARGRRRYGIRGGGRGRPRPRGLGVKRGEIWWIHFPGPVGRRPAVLISRDQAYRVRSAVTVIPLTRTVRSIPTEVLLGPDDGVPKRCAANADDMTTVPKNTVKEYLCILDARKIQALERAIKFALDVH